MRTLCSVDLIWSTMDSIRVYLAMLIASGGFIFISQISVSEEKKVDKVPIVWPVVPGTNRISCPSLQKTMFLKEKFQYLVWLKCVENCQSEDNHVWQRIARMNYEGSIHYENGTDALYTLYTDGILQIQNVTMADNNTEYRCEVRVWDIKTDHIMLRCYKEQQVDGKWSAWGAWSPCTKTCGTGTSTRERVCNNPVPTHGGEACGGEAYEAQVCSVGHCSTPPTLIPTQLPPVDGKWSAWGAWSPCTKTCGTGTSTRERVCNNPVPAHGGEACRGKVYEVQACSVGHCSNNPDTDSTCKSWITGFAVVTSFLVTAVVAVIALVLQSRRYRRGEPLQGVIYAVNPSNGSKECDSDDDMVNP